MGQTTAWAQATASPSYSPIPFASEDPIGHRHMTRAGTSMSEGRNLVKLCKSKSRTPISTPRFVAVALPNSGKPGKSRLRMGRNSQPTM